MRGKQMASVDLQIKTTLNWLAMHVLLFAGLSFLAIVIHKYSQWKNNLNAKRLLGSSARRPRKHSYHSLPSKPNFARARSLSLNAIPEKEGRLAECNAEENVNDVQAKSKILARKSSSVSHAVITKVLRPTPVALTLSFAAGDFTLDELQERRLRTDSHYKHVPEDTFVIFSGEQPVSDVVLDKSTQLAKMKKQGIVFFSQEERAKLSWDAKLKITGGHGKGDQRYLGRLQTITVDNKAYGLLVFDSEPVTHAQLKRQYKHHR